jgi:hypothetical protein
MRQPEPFLHGIDAAGLKMELYFITTYLPT